MIKANDLGITWVDGDYCNSVSRRLGAHVPHVALVPRIEVGGGTVGYLK